MTGIHPMTRQRARKLRAAMTPQERKLWWRLRDLNRMLGLNFRRQAPVGPFIADFADLGRRLVIEIDGGGHGGEHDLRRDAWFAAEGFQVLRFWNPEVSGNVEGVMQVVLDSVDAASHGIPPTPGPSPQGGGEAQGSPVAHRFDRAEPPSPLVGEGWGGGASGTVYPPEGSDR